MVSGEAALQRFADDMGIGEHSVKKRNKPTRESRSARKLCVEQLESRRLLAGLPGDGAFDFGTPSSPVEAGYVRVAHGDSFDAVSGFGWTAGTIRSADRRTGSDSERDFNYTRNGTFGVNAPNGEYHVELTLGDLGVYAHDRVGVFLEGSQVDEVTTSGREVVHRSYHVTVADGRLNLQLRDLGGRDVNAVIESMRITPLDVPPPLPVVSIADASKAEGDTGVQLMQFAVSLSAASADDVQVNYATVDGGANAGADYQAVGGTLTIAPGATSALIEVPVQGDANVEPNEQFSVALSGPAGAKLGDALAVGDDHQRRRRQVAATDRLAGRIL